MKAGTDLTFGTESSETGPVLTVSTTGAASGNGSSTGTQPGGGVFPGGGWPGGGGRPGGGGGGMGASTSGNPKAIKIMGNVVINSGELHTSTKQNGGEGLESKASITINGGIVTAATYDDGINAKTKFTVNGGVVWSHSSGNDGIDCNGNGGFELNGGIVLASGTRSPEEGFDCDNYPFSINGGYIIGTGGATSSVTKAKQAFATTSNVSITSNKYLSIKKSDGTVICSYLCPVAVSNGTVVTSVPEYVSGTSYSLVYGATAVQNPTASYLDGVFTIGGTLTGGSTKSITPKTK